MQIERVRDRNPELLSESKHHRWARSFCSSSNIHSLFSVIAAALMLCIAVKKGFTESVRASPSRGKIDFH
jgi:hypothetical protein